MYSVERCGGVAYNRGVVREMPIYVYAGIIYIKLYLLNGILYR